ncbi:MAG: hypothetical protein MUE51_04035 [Thermoleophilia bacterium]|jgi:hypothetical protein|nr:hypothetical protein [Thermoleophilia bacterium]
MRGDQAHAHGWHGLPLVPTTRTGRWAALVAILSAIGWLVALPAILSAASAGVWWPWGVLLLVGLILGLGGAIAASVLAVLAVVRHGERAVGVVLGLVPLACILLAAALDALLSGG